LDGLRILKRKGVNRMKNNVYDYQKGVQILERILCNKRASREKKILAMIGLVNMARRRLRVKA